MTKNKKAENLRQFETLVADCASNDPKLLSDALSRFAALGEDRVDQLFRYLEERAYETRYRVLKTAFLCVGSVLIPVFMLVQYHGADSTLAVLLIMAAMSAFCVALVVHSKSWWSRYHKSAAILLESVRDTGAASSLINALEYSDNNSAVLATATLCKIADRMDSVAASRLTAANRTTLRRSVARFESDEMFLQCAIRLFSLCGDEEAVNPVRRLVQHAERLHLSAPLLGQANAFLTEMAAREVARSSRSSLLRASAINDSADMLVRPTQANPEIAPEQLLRPGSTGSGDER